MQPILDIRAAAWWTAAVNRVLGTAMRPDEVMALPEETLWVVQEMIPRGGTD